MSSVGVLALFSEAVCSLLMLQLLCLVIICGTTKVLKARRCVLMNPTVEQSGVFSPSIDFSLLLLALPLV